MKKFKFKELESNQLRLVSGGVTEGLGKTQTAGAYSQETARDRDSKKEEVKEESTNVIID